MKQKGFTPILILLIIVVIAAMAGGAYYFTRPKSYSTGMDITKRPATNTGKAPAIQVDEIANWKTYTSGSFSLQYPNSWYANQYQKSKFDVYKDAIELSDLENSVENIKGGSNSYTRISIMSFAGSMPETFPYSNGSNQNSTIKSYTINSYQGIRGQETSASGLIEVVYLKDPEGGYVVITLTPPLDNSENTLKIFDQILSTFKFLK